MKLLEKIRRKKQLPPPKPLTAWQIVFLQSRANQGEYRGDELPPTYWQWPQGTWLQEKLRQAND